jgi:hypothetical protein
MKKTWTISWFNQHSRRLKQAVIAAQLLSIHKDERFFGFQPRMSHIGYARRPVGRGVLIHCTIQRLSTQLLSMHMIRFSVCCSLGALAWVMKTPPIIASSENGQRIMEPRSSILQDYRFKMMSLLEDLISSEKIALGMLQGPWLRLDIPKLIKDHDLFNMPNVCKKHVIYKDVDVIFANRITKQDSETSDAHDSMTQD